MLTGIDSVKYVTVSFFSVKSTKTKETQPCSAALPMNSSVTASMIRLLLCSLSAVLSDKLFEAAMFDVGRLVNDSGSLIHATEDCKSALIRTVDLVTLLSDREPLDGGPRADS